MLPFILPLDVKRLEARRRRMKHRRTIRLKAEKWMIAAALPEMEEKCGHLYGEECCVRVIDLKEDLVEATVIASSPEVAEETAARIRRACSTLWKAEKEMSKEGQET